MKNILLFLVMMVSGLILAQNEPIKVVFDVTSSNPDVHRTAAKHLRLMAEAYPESEFELVVYSGAFKMVDKKSSVAGETLSTIVNRDNVSIVICEQTMKKHKMTMDDLIPGVGSVPDGIYELVIKQKQGWGYIKEAQ
ncbi:DsrE family protein [Flagellimonas halotolerans]|uniref:DsrE family protein n=1 Tax=Flagellimonas halotolerans TaxID=3112164 RepID=A0ABU6IMF1_9FLAO|nr:MULTISPECIES: DsrE family protein [unclassified Allomuricauda]MEC3964425.1 DsrE family protein [Muricauda sp. SYSU M86414]MEC4264295.1 DsrE family protein [Muricauda sp. SYSU M84420]